MVDRNDSDGGREPGGPEVELDLLYDYLEGGLDAETETRVLQNINRFREWHQAFLEASEIARTTEDPHIVDEDADHAMNDENAPFVDDLETRRFVAHIRKRPR